MSYYFSKKTSAPFDDVLTKVGDELKKEGFGVLSETLGTHPDLEVRRYRLRGALGFQIAQPAQPEDATDGHDEEAGVELSCYVIAQGLPGGTVKVAAIDPGPPSLADDDSIASITATRAREKLYFVIANI